ncbi:MAG: hypothetical protein KGL35_14760 [Bradyrhizobium sp.]|nr:hypothetical protein [Bradyrhizobium sp.]
MTLRLLLALVCSWQTAYQIHDRYGDTFKGISALASSNPKTVGFAAPGSKDLDASIPLTLGRTLLPGHQGISPRLEAVRQILSTPTAYYPSMARIDLLSRAPPCRENAVFDPPPQRMPLLALAAVGSLAPPAV